METGKQEKELRREEDLMSCLTSIPTDPDLAPSDGEDEAREEKDTKKRLWLQKKNKNWIARINRAMT